MLVLDFIFSSVLQLEDHIGFCWPKVSECIVKHLGLGPSFDSRRPAMLSQAEDEQRDRQLEEVDPSNLPLAKEERILRFMRSFQAS